MKSIMLLAAATALSIATTAHVGPLPLAVHAGSASYISGGIGQDEADAMREARSQFPLTLMMSQSSGGNFVTGVDLRIVSASGQAVIHAASAGPIVLVHVPDGHYQIAARYDGKTLTRDVDGSFLKRRCIYTGSKLTWQRCSVSS